MNKAPNAWKNINLSSNIIIAIIALNIGIKCKKIPDLFGPINEIPFIQQMNDKRPGNKTT